MIVPHGSSDVTFDRFQRRRFLWTAGAASLPIVAGCTESGESNGNGRADDPDDTPAEDDVDDRDGVAEINGVPTRRNHYDLAEFSNEEWPQYGEDRILPPYCEYPNASAPRRRSPTSGRRR